MVEENVTIYNSINIQLKWHSWPEQQNADTLADHTHSNTNTTNTLLTVYYICTSATATDIINRG